MRAYQPQAPSRNALPASDPSAPRASRGAKPERLADRRPAERPLLAADEDRDENELPDESGGETHDQCLHHRHNAGAGEPISERGCDEPGEGCHRERGGRPHRQDVADSQLRNLDARDGGVSAGGSWKWKYGAHLHSPLLVDSFPRR
jgi:hypothetical protein